MLLEGRGTQCTARRSHIELRACWNIYPALWLISPLSQNELLQRLVVKQALWSRAGPFGTFMCSSHCNISQSPLFLLRMIGSKLLKVWGE